MDVRECPSCGARVLPGKMECRACGYDFIKGSRPQEWVTEETARQRTYLGAGAAAVLILAGILFMVLRPEEKPPEVVPCIDGLSALRAKVQQGYDAGAKIPACPDTPPGPLDCWSPFGVTQSDLGADEKYRLMGNPVTGFDIECRVDRDFDGNPALFRANPDVEPVRITPPEVI